MKIKEIIEALESVEDTTKPVIFDFCSCVPTKIDSWRGIYAEPAIGWEPTGYSSKTKDRHFVKVTVDALLIELKHAISGVEYTGWKGGEFLYDGDSILHVDNPGDCTNTEISAVKELSYYVVLCTEKDDD